MEEAVEEWAPWSLVISTKNPNAPPPVSVKAPSGPAWDIGQVCIASKNGIFNFRLLSRNSWVSS